MLSYANRSYIMQLGRKLQHCVCGVGHIELLLIDSDSDAQVSDDYGK